MLQQFKEFIRSRDLFDEKSMILLTVSGGIDSVVMAELFREAELNFSIAHCNFQLRGEDSEEDERFVTALAKSYNTGFFTARFDTREYADSRGISIQMAARELRYSWFEEIRREGNFNFIATGHQMDDLVETFFINLLRGTGITGLTGIPVKTGTIVRPLLFATREQIQEYASLKGLSFREDRSNNEIKYLRNFIRHRIIPLFQKQQPDFNRTIFETTQRLKLAQHAYSNYIEDLRKQFLQQDGERVILKLDFLKNLDEQESVLFELIRPFGFSYAVTMDICRALGGTPGKTFLSSSHRISLDRNVLLIDELIEERSEKFFIPRCQKKISQPFQLTFKVEKIDEFRIIDNPDLAFLDYEKIEFPLILKNWEKGDFFYPLGSSGHKKISDFLIDKKIPLPDKNKIWLLCSAGNIVWIIGHRIDHRFRVTKDTRKVLVVSYFRESPQILCQEDAI
ncbi:MAG: tRNA lysidine(34) synthetase TilS [Bacteroidetes bacterium]|nr:tRNA lysidine(34) synthetase TilS [Bacteroidota bacterium]